MPCPFATLVSALGPGDTRRDGSRSPHRPPRSRTLRLDGIDLFAFALLVTGLATLVLGTWLEPPASVASAFRLHYPDWAPGLVTDGLLLLVVNSILRRHERRRVLAQVGSLSREFALDAVRRVRGEGWLEDGAMRGIELSRSRLSGVDLSGGILRDADFSFSDLSGASLAYADLRGADLTGTDLSGADLRWCDLRGARLSWADLRNAHLDGARVEDVDARFASVDARHAEVAGLAGGVVGGFLDTSDIEAVRRSFELVERAGAEPIEGFYRRLFQEAPEVRSLFRSDPGTQARKLIQSLKVIVSALDAPQKHVAVLRRLGERHHQYGVRPEHYPIVTGALLETLEEALGPRLSEEAREAWRRTLELAGLVMTGGGMAPVR